MLSDPFIKAMPIIHTLENAGYEAYFVGGCVRDCLLQRKIKDIDIATSACPQIVQTLFHKVIPTGIRHGTVTVRHENESYEITTYRIEQRYTNQRHPDGVEFIRNIEEDLKRRDFTINAFAMDKDGQIIDLFHGKEDIRQRIIRTVGNARDRFMEDPLRMIRALRFTSQLGFFIEERTESEMKLLNEEIESIAIERIKDEMEQFFKGEYVDKGLQYLIKTDIFKHLPVFKSHFHLIDHIPKPLSAFHSFSEFIAMMHYLDRNISIESWSTQWKCSNKAKNIARNIYHALIEFEENGINPWLVYGLDKSNFEDFIHLTKLLNMKIITSKEELTNLHHQLLVKSRSEIEIKGDDLLALFPNYKKGPWIQQTLLKIERKIVLGKLSNNKNQLKEWVLCHPPAVN